jgi:hypothetical protein
MVGLVALAELSQGLSGGIHASHPPFTFSLEAIGWRIAWSADLATVPLVVRPAVGCPCGFPFPEFERIRRHRRG